ncbi:MAG: hypothetical protein H6813_00820 [Phycisphaeraceae bacterium]|nr:hypothetical protein [Phycisphaeraceae bacterium]MCB9847372.1 hypothetical protein [Phycisphaeraceae bacterium]
MHKPISFVAIGAAGAAIALSFVAVSVAQQPQSVGRVAERASEQPMTGSSAGVDIIDVEISECFAAREWGRVGSYPTGYAAFAISTQSHNVGTVPVEWYTPGAIGQVLDNRHPFIGQNMYRLRDGRLEQIGQAFIKHGFFSENAMCDPQPDGQHLGVGCFDTYDTVSNQIQQYLGPRSEVNPQTGYWEPCGSHFDTGLIGYPASDPGDCIRTHGTSGHTVTEHRLSVYDQDILDADANTDLFIEGFYIVAGDENTANNWRHERTQLDYDFGLSRWVFTDIGPQVLSPVIEQWADEFDYTLPAADGDAIVGLRVVDLGSGFYRYEYNVYNMDIDRELESFSVPINDGINLFLLGFHAHPEDEEVLYSMSDWTPTVTTDAITWTPPAPDTNAGEDFSNTIRYGTMYTFWFTTDVAPSAAKVALTHRKPGADGTITAAVSAPCSLLADINGDGVVDTADLGVLLSQFGTMGPEADLNGDMVVDTADLGQLLTEFGSNCFAG